MPLSYNEILFFYVNQNLVKETQIIAYNPSTKSATTTRPMVSIALALAIGK